MLLYEYLVFYLHLNACYRSRVVNITKSVNSQYIVICILSPAEGSVIKAKSRLCAGFLKQSSQSYPQLELKSVQMSLDVKLKQICQARTFLIQYFFFFLTASFPGTLVNNFLESALNATLMHALNAISLPLSVSKLNISSNGLAEICIYASLDSRRETVGQHCGKQLHNLTERLGPGRILDRLDNKTKSINS